MSREKGEEGRTKWGKKIIKAGVVCEKYSLFLCFGSFIGLGKEKKYGTVKNYL